MARKDNGWAEVTAHMVVSVIFAVPTIFFIWPWLGYQLPLPRLPAVQAEVATTPAWRKTQPTIDKYDRRSAAALDKRLAAVSAFFQQRSRGADRFAADALSWSSKWALVKGAVRRDESHARYLADAFSANLFNAEELQATLETTIGGFLADLDLLDNELLIELRADLADDALPRGQRSFLQSDETFRREYKRITDGMRPALVRDFHMTVGREVGTLVASEIATVLVLRIVASIAVDSGLSLGTGLLATAGSLGVGLVIYVVLNDLVDKLLQMAGHDPKGDLRRDIEHQLKEMEARIINGNLSAVHDYQKIKRMATQDPMAFVRDACQKALPRIEEGGHLGLRWELQRLQELRLKLRREALRKLLVEGGGA